MAGGAWWGACVTGGVHGKGGMHDRGYVWQLGHVWKGAICGGGMHGTEHFVAGGHAWQEVHGGRLAWQERQPLRQMVRILLECILVETTFNKYSSFHKSH